MMLANENQVHQEKGNLSMAFRGAIIHYTSHRPIHTEKSKRKDWPDQRFSFSFSFSFSLPPAALRRPSGGA